MIIFYLSDQYMERGSKLSELEKKDTWKKYVQLGIIFSVIFTLCYFSWTYLHDSENQFNTVKEQIEYLDFECVEGFDGVEYGYTGEIQYRHGLFDGLGVIGFENNLTNEQAEILVKMLLSKVSTLPCYDKYIELGNSMLVGRDGKQDA